MVEFQETYNPQNNNNGGLNRQRSMFDIAMPGLQQKTEVKLPILYKYEPFFGHPKKIFTIFESILLIFCITIAIISSQGNQENNNISYSLQLFVIIILFSFMIYLTCSLWCCSSHSKEFKDDITRINTNSKSDSSQYNLKKPQWSVDLNGNPIITKDIIIHPGSKFRDDFNFRFVL